MSDPNASERPPAPESYEEPAQPAEPIPEFVPAARAYEPSAQEYADQAQAVAAQLAAQEAQRPHRVWVSWVCMALLGLVYWRLGAEATAGEALAWGALSRDALEVDPWRLVWGSAVHANGSVFVASLFMVWLIGAEVERRLGSAWVAAVVIVGGGLLNVIRVSAEGDATLLRLGGAWPAGLVLWGLAVGVCLRGRELAGVFRALLLGGIDLLILGQVVAQEPAEVQAFLARLMAGATALGLVAGLLHPPGRGGRAAAAGLWVLTAGVLVGALAAFSSTRSLSEDLPRGLSELLWGSDAPAGPRAPEPLEVQTLDELELEIGIPVTWRRYVDDQHGGPVVFFRQGDAATAQLQLDAFDAGPFDATDTTLARLVDRFVREGFPKDPVSTQDQGFTGAKGLGHVIALLGTTEAGKPVLVRYYMLEVGDGRMALVQGLAYGPWGPGEREAEAELFDRVAASLRGGP